MNPRYREVVRAHRRLVVLPIALAAFVALWAALAAPNLYRARATLWADSVGSAQSSALGAPPPSADNQQSLSELLTTRFFDATVARDSPLGRYVEEHADRGWGPTALLGRLKGSPGLEDRIAAALGPKRVTSRVNGPHVLEVAYDAPTPSLAVETLRVIVREFIRQRGALQENALSAAQEQVAAASQTLRDTRTRLTRYMAAHPGASSGDAQVKALLTAEQQAFAQVRNASAAVNQATIGLDNGAGAQGVLRVIDPPQAPAGPTAGKRRIVKALFAGVFVGGLISILCIVLLARTRDPRRRDEDATEAEPVTSTLASNGSDPAAAEPAPVSSNGSQPPEPARPTVIGRLFARTVPGDAGPAEPGE